MNRFGLILLVAVVLSWTGTPCHAVVDLNTASVSELQTLPGIGPGLAQSIIDFREVNGPFLSVHELTNVPRIGDKTFQRLKELLTVGSQSAEPGMTTAIPSDKADTSNLEPIVKPTPTPEPSMEEILSSFDNEPSIRDVQQAAIHYAQINPVRFAQWRQKVKERGLWPEVVQFVVGHDTDDDEDYTRSKTVGVSSGTAYVGPDDETWGWDTDDDWDYEFRLRWNLQDYVFHNDMLKISAETEDQVELRQEIIEDVTKLYFDRKRLKVEMILQKNVPISLKMKRHLQLEEMTAALDGMTGGYFSESIQNNNP